MSPQESLRNYCNINDVPYHVSWDRVVDYMVQNPTNKIGYNTPYARLFQLIQQYIQGSLSLEGLMTSGDQGVPYHMATSSGDFDCIICDSLVSVSNHNNIIYID